MSSRTYDVSIPVNKDQEVWVAGLFGYFVICHAITLLFSSTLENLVVLNQLSIIS